MENLEFEKSPRVFGPWEENNPRIRLTEKYQDSNPQPSCDGAIAPPVSCAGKTFPFCFQSDFLSTKQKLWLALQGALKTPPTVQ